MKQNILVAYDFSVAADRALAWATALASRIEGSLTVLYIAQLPVPLEGAAGVIPYPTAEDLEAVRVELRQAVAAVSPGAGIEVMVAVSPGEAIVQRARSLGASLIVMGTHGRGAIRRAFLGSVADYVVRHAECPVTTLRETSTATTEVHPKAGAQAPTPQAR